MGTVKYPWDDALATAEALDRVQEPSNALLCEAADTLRALVAEVRTLSDVVARVQALQPTLRHRGGSWGDGNVEFVNIEDLRKALRP